MLTKPRAVWACQPVTFMTSANVAPLGRFINSITSAFLMARSVFVLGDAFFARCCFFAALGFFAVLRFGSEATASTTAAASAVTG